MVSKSALYLFVFVGGLLVVSLLLPLTNPAFEAEIWAAVTFEQKMNIVSDYAFFYIDTGLLFVAIIGTAISNIGSTIDYFFSLGDISNLGDIIDSAFSGFMILFNFSGTVEAIQMFFDRLFRNVGHQEVLDYLSRLGF